MSFPAFTTNAAAAGGAAGGAPPIPIQLKAAALRPGDWSGQTDVEKRLEEYDLGRQHEYMQKSISFISTINRLNRSSTDDMPYLSSTTTASMVFRDAPTRMTLNVIRPSKGCSADTFIKCCEINTLLLNSPDKHMLISGTIGLATCMMGIEDDNTFNKDLIDSGLIVHFSSVSTDEELMTDVLGSFGQDDDLMTRAGFDQGEVSRDQTVVTLPPLNQATIDMLFNCQDVNQAYAMSGTILALMGKMLNEQNASEWRQRRWRALCGGLGADIEGDLIFTKYPISVASWKRICAFLNTATSMRVKLITAMRAALSYPNSFGKLSGIVVKYLRWSEMSHIGLIAKYIFQLHPYLIYMPELAPYMDTYMDAIQRLQEMQTDPRTWCYTKVLQKTENVEFLNRQKFILLTALATEIGRSHSTTLTSYMGGSSELSNQMRSIKDKALAMAWAMQYTMCKATPMLSSCKPFGDFFDKLEITDEEINPANL